MPYTVYILQCADSTLYTGCTNNVEKRLANHNAGGVAGAKYTRSRRPVSLVYSEPARTKSLAQKREAEIKRMTRQEKIQMIGL
ncbi:MAG: GIY-YIG nuclease family protein [Patescibacteria group bacterium]